MSFWFIIHFFLSLFFLWLLNSKHTLYNSLCPFVHLSFRVSFFFTNFSFFQTALLLMNVFMHPCLTFRINFINYIKESSNRRQTCPDNNIYSRNRSNSIIIFNVLYVQVVWMYNSNIKINANIWSILQS